MVQTPLSRFDGLTEFGMSAVRRRWWGERPYKCNFLKLREKALAAFDSVAAER